VLDSLWTPSSLFYTRVRLLDTLLNDTKSQTGFRWLFTDQHGQVRRRSEKNAGIEHIIKSFISTALQSSPLAQLNKDFLQIPKPQERSTEPDLLTATVITDSDYRIINRQQAVSVINQRGVGLNSALQQFIYPYKELDLRYRVTYKAAGGRFVYSFHRVRVGKEETELLKAGEMCRKMQETEREVRTVLERTTGQRVMELALVFLMDQTRTLWLSGSTSCFLAPAQAFQTLLSLPRTPAHKSVLSQRLPSVQSVGTFRDSVYLPTQASMAHTFRTFPAHIHPGTQRCAGDFCSFVLSELKALQRGEVDYDDLIKVIRTAYSSDGQSEAMNIKLAIAVDYLSMERSKLKSKTVTYTIPNKYLILGRQLIKRSRWKQDLLPGDQLEIDLTPLVQLGGRLYLLQDEITEIEHTGQIQPFFYYNSVKVCGRCYPIYLMIRKAHLNAIAAAAALVSPPPVLPVTRTPHGPLQRRASMRGSIDAETIVTSLGRINKNNLDDLLADIRFAQEEGELETKTKVRSELSLMYRDMTEGEKRKKEEEKRKEEKERAHIIEPKKVEGHSLEQDLTLRFFPAENTKALRVFDEKSKNTLKWRQFLEKRKHVRPKTSE